MKERWINLFWAAVIFVFAFGINEILWLLDIVVLVVMATLFVPIKFLLVIRYLGQLSHEATSKYLLIIFGILVLFMAFLFDFETLPSLWAFRFGLDTKGTITDLTVKSKGSHFVTYEFRANGVLFMKEQRVMTQRFESLTIGGVAPVKYLVNNPNISFMTDPPFLKVETWLNVFVIFGVLVYSLYSESITNIVSQSLRRSQNT